jgi:hypothetical protein
MRRTKTPWHDSSNPGTVVRGATWRGWVWVITAVVMIGLIVGGIWAVGVATSDVRGAGDAEAEINSAGNRIAAQQWFPAQLGSIKATDAKLDGLYAIWQANVGKADESWHQGNYVGTQNLCLQFIENYDAEARKVTRERWIDQNMPLTIDKSDPATDCRATKEPKQ